MPDTIDVEYTSSMDGAPREESAPASSMSRAAVLGAARTLAAAVIGMAALVEGAAAHPHMRPLFLDGWRRWCGEWLGYYHALERGLPWNIEEEARKVAQHATELRQWRGWLKSELGQMPALSVGAEPKPVNASIGGYPWWAIACVGGGLIWGAYKGIGWIMNSWHLGNSTPAIREDPA